jgi:hypothetical protein
MGYKLRNGCSPHPRPLLCILTRDPYSKSLLQLLKPSPDCVSSPETLTPSPHSKSGLCILHSRPLLQLLKPSPHSNAPLCILHSRPLLQLLTPMHQYVSFTRDPYYATLLCPFVQYIGINKSVIYLQISTVLTLHPTHTQYTFFIY